MKPDSIEDRTLLGHWPLATDARDTSGSDLRATVRHVTFRDGAAVFDGLDSVIEIAEAGRLDFKADPFTLAAWIHTERNAADAIGDIFSRFDAAHRTGFALTIKGNPGGPGNHANRRNLQFGMDCGSAPVWEFCGRPGNTRMIYALAVHAGALYAATHETSDDARGHVFQYESGQRWTDCGAPDERNAIYSIVSWEGDLYATTACDEMDGSLQSPPRNLTGGAGVYRYRGGTEWEDCGCPFSHSRVALGIVDGALYARSIYHPHLFRYEGGKKWSRLDGPNVAFWGCISYRGKLYAAPKRLKPRYYPDLPHPDPYPPVWRYDQTSGWQGCHTGLKDQPYGFAIHQGALFTGNWPGGEIFQTRDGDTWTSCGACGLGPLEGEIKGEIMAMAPYNGKLYVGSLPWGEVYRYDGDGQWALIKRLDLTPDAPIRRVWSAAEYDGRLFFGTLPGGAIYAMKTGAAVFDHRELAPGWRHIAAVRDTDRLRLYIDGAPIAESAAFSAAEFNLSTDAPLQIGAGPHNFFQGRMRDVRLYGRALAPNQITELANQQFVRTP